MRKQVTLFITAVIVGVLAQAGGVLCGGAETFELKEPLRQALLNELFATLDPAPFGEKYASALKKGDRKKAVAAVAAYYRSLPRNSRFKDIGKEKYDRKVAERSLSGDVTVIGRDWKFKDGRILFLQDITALKGPRNNEWIFQLNRHEFWSESAKAYAATGDPRYPRAFNRQLRDWLAQAGVCPRVWNTQGSAWRTIDTGLRLMTAWPMAFESFRGSPELTDETICLMLASMHNQARHLIAHPTGGNWLMMEMNGAYTFGTLFPEFRDSDSIRKEAVKRIGAAFQKQMLPDGMHNELTPSYHIVVFCCVYQVLELARQYDRTAELPPDFIALLRLSCEALFKLSTPNFVLPRCNDGSQSSTAYIGDRMSRIFPDDPVYRWYASNRAEGTPPQWKTASQFLPWAGYAVMRSDFGADALYVCFDVGPLGMAHIHNDKLNIILFKGGEELLHDDGGGEYEHTKTREYAGSSANHNTVMVDGKPQTRRTPGRVDSPIDAAWISAEDFDYARSVYDDEFGWKKETPALHRREVRLCKPDFVCVADTLISRDGKPHRYDLVWQLDTTDMAAVPEFPGAWRGRFGRRYDLLIVPLYTDGLKTGPVSGQTKPCLSGWYVGHLSNGGVRPSTTLTMTAASRRDFRFATLLFPLEKGDALPKIEKNTDGSFRIFFKGRETCLSPERLSEK